MNIRKDTPTFQESPALVIQAARFGDLVQTVRLLKSLERNGETHLCIDTSLAELAKILYPEIISHFLNFHSPSGCASFQANLQEISRLAEIPFKKIYNCNYSSLTDAISRLFPIKNVHGYRASQHADGGIWRSQWLRTLFRLTRSRKITSINLVDAWGLLANNPIASTSVNPAAKGAGKGLGLVLSGRESRRSLPPELLANIASICFKVMKPQEIRLFGVASDIPMARKLLRLLPPAIQTCTMDLTGKTDWQSLKENVQGLDLLLCPDTGTMHLASFLGTPVMAFFLSSAWCHETGPYGNGHMIWQSCPDCAPCLENIPCKNNLRCLEVFSPQNFSRSLVQALEKGSADCSPSLQLWRTDHDELGQKLLLAGGEDKFSESRGAARAILSTWVGLSTPDSLKDYSANLLASLSEELFPADEWMLPPWRYC